MKRRDVDWKRYNIMLMLGLLSLPLICLYVAPAVHETAHMVSLDMMDCPAYMDMDLEGGMSATIHTNCRISPLNTSFVFLSGILSTFMIGILLLSSDIHLTRKNHLEISAFLSYIALGFFYTTSEYFFKEEGDIINALDTLGLPYSTFALKLAGIGLLSACMLYFVMNLIYTTRKEAKC